MKTHCRNSLLSAVFVVGISIAAIHAENLVYNGGFELGMAGFEMQRMIRSDQNKEMRYIDARIDREDAESGACILVQNQYSERSEVWGREFALKAKTTYTFSVSCKASIDEYPIEVAILSVEAQWINHGKSFTAGKIWKRYSFSFTTDGSERTFSYFLRCAPKDDTPAADIRFDSIQVETGASATPWQPSTLLEIGIVPDRMIYVNSNRTQSIASLECMNYASAPWNGNVSIELVDDFSDGKRLPLTNLTITLAAGEKRSIPVPVLLERYGTFIFDALLDGKKSRAVLPGYIAVLGPYTPKPVNLERDFVVGINGNMDISRGGKGQNAYVTYRANGMDHREYMRMMSLMGCRLLRIWDPGEAFDLSAIESERGVKDFSLPDMTVNTAGEFNISVLPVVGGSGFICTKTKGWPEWVRESATRIKPPEWMKNADYVGIPADDVWKHFVHDLAARYKGKITHYEIGNEPNLYLPATNYVPLLKSAYTEIKTIDPAAHVLGFCTTGDLGGNVAEFFKQAYALDSLSFADIVSFHPYDAPELGSVSPADKQIETVRALQKQYGHDKPLWNTELYYVKSTDFKHWYDKEHVPGEYSARRFLTDLGEGLKQSISLNRHALFQSPLHSKLRHNFGVTRWQPSDIFVVQNALARHFEGAKPVKKIRWVPDCICYVYERNGTYSAAFWRYGTADGVSVKLNMTDANAELFDMFGNKVALSSMPLILATKPYYITWKGGSSDAFIQALASAEVGTGVPVVFGAAHLVPSLGGWAVAAAFQNNFNKELQLRCGVQGGVVAEDIAEAVLAPGSSSGIVIPVLLKGPGGGSAVIRAYANRKMYDFPVDLGTAKRIAAASREKGPAEQIAVNSAKASHTAAFRAYRDDDALTVSIKVNDATPSGEPGTRHPWEQDCVELFFDADPAAVSMKGAGLYHDRVARLFVMPYAPKEKQMTLMPKGLTRFTADEIRYTVDIRNDGYVVTVRVPFASLGVTPESGSGIGFDVAVDDAVGASKAQAQIMWNSGGDAYKNRASFGYIRFE
ncbi:MAG: carbohydrate binding domain-containing protein [Spirochaetes bacterium]|nr:carbohydrate binding domain-containing protein [Spirochaetota bacterium]